MVKTIDSNMQLVKEKIIHSNYFYYSSKSNALHLGLEPLFISGELGDKHRLLEKLEILDSLRMKIPDRKSGIHGVEALSNVKKSAEEYLSLI